MKFHIEEPEITVAFIVCLILIIVGYVTGNHYNGVATVIFSVLLVKNINNPNKNTLLYIKRVFLIMLLAISFVSILLGY
ncbi:MAG: hypothetical protein J1E85_03690 [Ruminococcus sp.]|nr:hypothetical protein [Ruminococcus sp.]